MKSIFFAGVTLSIAYLVTMPLHAANTGTTSTTLTTNISEFKTKQDIKDFYFEHIRETPKTLDAKFNREFFQKHPITCHLEPYNPMEQPLGPGVVKSAADFIRAWSYDENVSLLEGLYIYSKRRDAMVYGYLKLAMNGKFEGYPPAMGVAGFLAAKVYNADLSLKERDAAFAKGERDKVYMYHISSELVGKAVLDSQNQLPDDILKVIVNNRPDAILKCLQTYGPHYVLTPEQSTLFKDLGFQLSENTIKG